MNRHDAGAFPVGYPFSRTRQILPDSHRGEHSNTESILALECSAVDAAPRDEPSIKRFRPRQNPGGFSVTILSSWGRFSRSN